MLGASANPATRNQPVTFGAFVSGGGSAPSGTVTFSSSINGTLGPAMLDATVGAGRAIGAGSNHSCALTAAGGVKCWGSNLTGQLGNGSNSNSNAPVDVSGLGSDVVAVASGSEHNCALTVAGGIKCWGYNGSGQLGNGLTMNSNVPVDVSGLGSGVVAIAGGFAHTCALTAAGGVKCWGNNQYGRLGNGGTTDSYVPVDVVGLGSGAVAVTAGYEHSCAVTEAGGVKCWGYNGSGQLGNGGTTSSNVPANVTGLDSGLLTVAAGGSHSCAITGAGVVKCWGFNDYGQLGNGTVTTSNVPVNVTGLGSGVAALAPGFYHTCALTAAGGVKCWGYNGNGSLGDGSTTNRVTPVNVTGLGSGAVAVNTGDYHSCALTATGGVECWGYNTSGQLGDGSTTNRTTPVNVQGGLTALGIAKASLTTSALAIGTQTITASYGGDSSHSASAGNLTLTVPGGAPHDFNGDGKSDVLWRDTGGSNALWQMNGATVSSVALLGGVDTSWSIVGQRDFDGDGKTDILWRSNGGSNAIWFMNGSTVTSVSLIGGVAPTWAVVGTADLNGDGKGDIIWRNTDGTVAVWLMNGATVSSVAVLGGIGTNWSVAGTADFNGDGKGDILWRDAGGNNAVWFMNGATVSSVSLLGSVGTNWTVAGTADFNGDGKGDVLWRDAGGNNAVWFMNGATVSSVALLGAVGTNWSVASNGDYDGDGKGDILWRDAGGSNAIWFMNGAAVTSVALIGGVATNWTVQNAGAN